MIKEVSISNFKAFKEAKLTLGNLTLFTGVNGMGKSSFIQALLLLRQSQLDKVLPERLLLNHDKYVKLGRSEDVFNMYAEDTDKLKITLKLDNEQIIKVVAPSATDTTWLDIIEFEPEKWGDVVNEPLFNNNFQYLQAERISPKISYTTNKYSVEVLRSLGSLGEYTAHFIGKYKDEKVTLPSLIDSDAVSDTLLAHIDMWLAKISKGVRIIPYLDEKSDSAQIFYQFEVNGDLTPSFSSVNVGFGLTYILPILTAVLSAKSGDLLIIENPESHLHPSGQARVGQFLALAAQDGVQIIIETHSDHILNGIRVATKHFHAAAVEERIGKGIDCNNTSVYFFTRKKHQHITDIIPVKINEEGRLSKWPKDFFDEWDNMLNELLD